MFDPNELWVISYIQSAYYFHCTYRCLVLKKKICKISRMGESQEWKLRLETKTENHFMDYDMN